IVRTLCEATCGGFLDGIDASTSGITSVGPFRLKDRAGGQGQVVGGLGALLSYAREYELADYRTTVEDEGLQPDKLWHVLGHASDGADLFDRNIKENTCGVAFEREGYPLTSLTRHGASLSESSAETLRGWHWVYRMARAGRRDGFARSIWRLLQVRILDLAAAVWPNQALSVDDSRPTLGDVFTSEVAWAVLVLRHLRHPGEILKDSKVSPA